MSRILDGIVRCFILNAHKDRSDSFQFMVLKYDCCEENKLGWGIRIRCGKNNKKATAVVQVRNDQLV